MGNLTQATEPAAGTVRAIEHIGLCVPDIEAATAFFVDALGAVPLYDLLHRPVPGKALSRMVGVPLRSRLERIRMLRLGNGPNVELFQYANVAQRPAPRHCDYGVQHFAVYVDDIDAALARLRRAGCVAPAEVMDLPDNDSGPGNRFAYVELPWGGWMELVAIPSSQLYERDTALRRWRPAR